MALAHSPKIITDGLVLALDAGNTKSYPSSGTAWTDLSGNGNNGTLVNGVGYTSSNGGALTFDGSNDYVQLSIGNLWRSAAWSVNIWVYFDVISVTGFSDDRPLIHHGTAATRQGLHLISRNGIIYFGMFGDDLFGPAISANTWYNFVFTMNNSSYARQIYVNGTLTSSGTAGGPYVGGGSNTRMGGPVVGVMPQTYFDGRIPKLLLYNRVITADEVLQNYNALKGRYTT